MKQPTSEKKLKKRHNKQHYNPALSGVLYDDSMFWDLYYVFHNTKEDLVDSLCTLPSAAWQYAKKYWWKAIFTVLTAYTLSPQIWYDKNYGSWIKLDAINMKKTWLDSLYHTNHEETNYVIRLVSWLSDDEIRDWFVDKYGNDSEAAFDSVCKHTPKDVLMYKCLANVMMSIHNPHMWFEWDYKRDILWDALWYEKTTVGAKVDEFRAYMQVGNVKKLGLFSDTNNLKYILDSIALSNNKKPLDSAAYKTKIISLFQQWAKKIVNNIFAEAWHVRGMHKDGVIRYYVDYTVDYLKSWFSQRNLYQKKWSQEHRTHSEDLWYALGDEWILITQFIEMYEKNMPKASKFHISRLIHFLDWYFDNYKDVSKAQLYKERLQWLVSNNKITP